MIKSVIFDLDDTLTSEKGYAISGFRHIALLLSEKFQIDNEIIFKELVFLFETDTNKVFNRFFEKHKIIYNESCITDLINKYRNHIPQIKFYNDVIPCIQELKKKNIRSGIITDGYLNSQKQKLKALNAYDYFDKIIITSELGQDYFKPNPYAFTLIKDFFGFEYDEMIYIGDNPNKDFFISSIYPIKCIRIMRENAVYKNADYKGNIKESYRINSLQELNRVI